MEAGTLYRYDVAADTADLATYAERPAGFAFLAIDVNPAYLYIKASATSGDLCSSSFTSCEPSVSGASQDRACSRSENQ